MADNNSIGPKIVIEGEKEFKAAMQNVTNEFKLLDSEMKLAVSQFDKNDKSTAALTAKNQALGKEIDSQKGKISILTAQYDKQNSALADLEKKLDATKKAFGADSAEVAKAQKEYDQQTNKVRTLETELNKASTGLNKMDRELVSNNEHIKQAITNFDNLSNNINSKVNGAFKGLAIGLGAAAVGLGAMVMKATENADMLQQMADITGLSAERLQELTYIGAKVDVELSTMTGSQKFLTKAMAAAQIGTKAQSDIFKELGISVVDNTGHLRNSNDVFTETIAALGKMPNETERNAMALKIFGKSAMALNPLIKTGADEIARLTEEAHKSGAVISNETILAMDKFSDSQAAMGLQLQGVIANAFAPLIPKLQEVADKLANIDTKPLTDGLKWVMDNAGTIGTAILGVVGTLIAYKLAVVFATIVQEIHNAVLIASALAHGGLSAASIALTAATGGKTAATLIASGAFIAHSIALAISTVAHGVYSAALGIATAAQWLFNAAMTANPIGVVVLALAALGLAIYAVVENWKEICTWIQKAWDWLTKWNGTPVKDKTTTVTTNYVNKTAAARTGFASGTTNASPGVHWVGENGPELVNFRGGETVLNARDSAKVGAGAIMNVVMNVMTAAEASRELNILSKQLASQI